MLLVCCKVTDQSKLPIHKTVYQIANQNFPFKKTDFSLTHPIIQSINHNYYIVILQTLLKELKEYKDRESRLTSQLTLSQLENQRLSHLRSTNIEISAEATV